MSGVTPVKSYEETCQNIARCGKTRTRRKYDERQILNVPLTSMSIGVASFKSSARESRFPSEDAFQRGETMVQRRAFCGTEGPDAENGELKRRQGRCGRRETMARVWRATSKNF